MDFDVRKMREGIVITRSWEPMEFSGWQDENLSWKEDCYIGDWSQMVEFRVTGPDAMKVFKDFAVNNFDNQALRQAKHIIFCNNDGMIIGEGICIKFGENDYEFQSGGPVWSWIEYNCKKGGYNVKAEKRDTKFKYQVSGPKSIFLLEKMTGRSLRDIKFMHLGEAVLEGVTVDLMRQGMAGEIGFEVQGPKEYGPMLYEAIYEAGKEFNIRRIGARTAMVNHMEACFPTVVHDYLPAVMGEAERDYFEAYKEKLNGFDRFFKVSGSYEASEVDGWYHNPYELGWSNRVNFKHDFYGKAALEKIAAAPARKIVSLVWNTEDVIDIVSSMFRNEEEPYDFMELPRTQWYSCNVHKIMDGDKLIGMASNRCFSYYFRQTISHGVIDLAYAEPGTEVTVVWGEPGHRQKTVRAIVAPAPFKQDNRYTDLEKITVTQ